MTPFRLSSKAEEDIEAILIWTHAQFGDLIRQRYEELVVRGILYIVKDPNRLGSIKQMELGDGVFTYHQRHSRDHVSRFDRIGKPRHFIVYRVVQGGCLEIGRVLHDSMDIARHLPFDYDKSSPDGGDD